MGMNEADDFVIVRAKALKKKLTIGNDAGMLLYEEMTGDETIGLETM